MIRKILLFIIKRKNFLGLLFVVPFLFVSHAYASVLPPGTINTCGELAASSTYTLGSSFGSGGDCLTVTSDGVVIKGAGHTITGNINGNGADTVGDGNGNVVTSSTPGYNFELDNTIVTGTVSANGGNNYVGNGTQDPGGAGGSILIATSTIGGIISANGGVGYSLNSQYGRGCYKCGGAGGTLTITNSTTTENILAGGGTTNGPPGGAGGTITISGSHLNISNILIGASGGSDSCGGTCGGNGADGSVVITYNNSLVSTGATLSSLSSLSVNGPLGLSIGPVSFPGGNFPVLPGTITTCGTIVSAGTYTLGSGIGSGGDCLTIIDTSGVTINGAGHTITGNINGNGTDGRNIDLSGDTVSATAGSSFELDNATVTGTISANGGNDPVYAGPSGAGGSFIISSSTIESSVSANGGSSENGPQGGNGGSITITGTDVNLSGVSISATGGTDGCDNTCGGNGTDGSVTVGYSATLSTSGTSLSSLSAFTLNTPGPITYGPVSYDGGGFPLIPGTINTCGALIFPDTYTLGSGFTTSGTCFSLGSDNVTINGAGHTITGDGSGVGIDARVGGGNIPAVVSSANAYTDTNIKNITLSNFSIGVDADGNQYNPGDHPAYDAGSMTISTSTLGSITAIGGVAENSVSGNSGVVNLLNSTVASVNVTGSASDYGNGVGATGDVYATSSTITGAVIAVGGNDTPYGGYGASPVGGTVILFSSHAGSVDVSGGGTDNSSNLPSGGVANIIFSTVGPVVAQSGGNLSSAGGTVYVATSTVTSIDASGQYVSNLNGPTGGTVIVASSTVTSFIDTRGGESTTDDNTSVWGDGNGGPVTVTDSHIGGMILAYSPGSKGTNGVGNGGTVQITRSTVADTIDTHGTAGNRPRANSGGNGGEVDIYSSTVRDIEAYGGDSPTNTSGNGANVTIVNSTAGAIDANAGAVALYADGGNGGTITVSSSTVTSIDASSNDEQAETTAGVEEVAGGGTGGAVTVTNSTVSSYIYSIGGAGHIDYTGPGGSIEVTNSTVGNIDATGGSYDPKSGVFGGEVNTSLVGGLGGTITISESTAGTITSDGGVGYSDGGNGGTINFYAATSSAISSNGGDSADCGNGGDGGTITITGYSIYGALSTASGANTSGACAAKGTGMAGNQNITDVNPPIISINGSNPTILTIGGTYVEHGATAYDAVSGSEPVTTSGTVNTNVAGTYHITYRATDGAGNTGSASRTVIVNPASQNSPSPTAPSAVGPSQIGEPVNFNLNFQNLNPLVLPPLPKVTTNVDVSRLGVTNVPNPLANLKAPNTLNLSTLPNVSFIPSIDNFLFAPLPPSLSSLASAVDTIDQALVNEHITNSGSLYKLVAHPILLPDISYFKKPSAIPPNLFFVSTVSGLSLPVYLTIASQGLVEKVTASTSPLTITWDPSPGKISAFLGKTPLKIVAGAPLDTLTVAIPSSPGTYILTITQSKNSSIIHIVVPTVSLLPSRVTSPPVNSSLVHQIINFFLKL